jgi:hypothetical protein
MQTLAHQLPYANLYSHPPLAPASQPRTCLALAAQKPAAQAEVSNRTTTSQPSDALISLYISTSLQKFAYINRRVDNNSNIATACRRNAALDHGARPRHGHRDARATPCSGERAAT